MPGLMIYGANGYTGTLIAERAVAQGLAPVLAGRNGAAVAELGRRLGCPALELPLDDGAALRAALAGMGAVLHCAGPFAETWRSMVDACLASGTHYIDITGEAEVFQGCARRSAEAEAAGIVLMPGAGFDVVPTDCLAAMLKARMPGAVALSLAFSGGSRMSRGTLRTAARGLGRPPLVRRGGRLVERTEAMQREVDFGEGPVTVRATTWGDIVTAAKTTGIGDIEVFIRVGEAQRAAFRTPVEEQPPGPDADERAAGRALIWGEARDAEGGTEQLRLTTREGYGLTALTAVEITRRVLAGGVAPGWQTPAGAFGADFVLEFDGSEMIGEGGKPVR